MTLHHSEFNNLLVFKFEALVSCFYSKEYTFAIVDSGILVHSWSSEIAL